MIMKTGVAMKGKRSVKQKVNIGDWELPSTWIGESWSPTRNTIAPHFQHDEKILEIVDMTVGKGQAQVTMKDDPTLTKAKVALKKVMKS